MKRSYGPGPSYVKRRRGASSSPMEFAAVVDVPTAMPPYARRGYFTSKTGYRNFRRKYNNVRYGGYLGQEKKYLDQYYAQTNLSASVDWSGCETDPATTNCLNAVAQGDGVTNRDGNKYCITEINIKGLVSMAPQANQTGPDSAPHVFLALVQDKQTNAAQLNSEDVYVNPQSGGGITQGATMPFRNIQYSKRFKVLKTWAIQLPPPPMTYDGTNVEQGSARVPFDVYVKLKKPIYVECKGTSANVTDIVDNSLHMIATYENSTEGVSVLLSYNSRIRFYG